jgi:hypothetical protein
MKNELKNSEYYINHKVGTETGFSVPTHYFDSIENGITSEITEKRVQKDTAFKVPKNYFNTIENNILLKVLSIQKETKVTSFKTRILKIAPFVAAASIILFIVLNSSVFKTKELISLDSLSNNDLEYWLDSTTLNTNDIATILQDDILNENEFYFTYLKDESIEEYINSLDNYTYFME